MKYVLTQYYTFEHKDLYALTSGINKIYAEKNGFEYQVSSARRCKDRVLWWEKIAWLMELLTKIDEGTMVIYQDCDSISIGGNPKNVLPTGFEFGMIPVRTGLGGNTIINHYNAGVIIMLNTSDVRAFLKRVWDRNDETDERSINLELAAQNNTIGNNKPIYNVGAEWNCWDNNQHHVKETCIKSWHGVNYEEKLKLIKAYLKD